MKKLFIAISILLFSALAYGAVDDGITSSGCDKYNNDTKVCTIAWANDTGTDVTATLIHIDAGDIVMWETKPDATNAPTANYDVKILQENDSTNGMELIENMDNLSATANEGDRPLMGGAYGPVPTNGSIYVYVSGLTNGNDDEGQILLYIKEK